MHALQLRWIDHSSHVSGIKASTIPSILNVWIVVVEDLFSLFRPDSDEEEDDFESDGEHKLLLIDGWLQVRVKTSYVAALETLRSRLAQCLASKVASPKSKLPASQTELLVAISSVLGKEWDESGLDNRLKWNGAGTQESFQSRYFYPSLIESI